ncbi:NSFL1 cofactor p47-like [Dendronephthya gigantea]|uniref:NSFL1 cofactor p47-like n=1 Tax=Dendronephthya gigantea TaxID=151771 RepID=UPI00106D56C5|nr:NSFL1 cofactor p47-like [Dendronephthya gigantea]
MADEGQQNELITQFTAVTGADSGTSRFYLEQVEWDLQFALSNFFDDGPGDGMQEADVQPSVQPEPPVSQHGGITRDSSNQRFGTIAGLNVAAQESEESDEEGQAFYAGGSETSGQQIVGPPRKKKEKSNKEMTQSLFDAAKRHGAEVVDKSQESSSKQKAPAFRGSGFRLGDTEGASDPIGANPSDTGPPEPLEVNLNFWSNGFSVGDGPLRDMNDPENAQFLDSVGRGEIPRELHHLNRGGEVHVNMVDKRNEEYVKPKETMKAFTGAGHMLGSPTPKVVTSRVAPQQSSDSSQTPMIDDSQPVTNLQIRLADGTRLVAKFNHSNTISDIRNFVNASRPHAAGRDYVLMTTFPNKELTDETLTLAEAKLLNAVVVQKYK